LNLIRTGDLHRQAMLEDDNSLGQDAADNVKEDLKFELALLNVALKKLDADLDFALLINPLLADQGPAIAVVSKLKRQIDRQKLEMNFSKKRRPNRCKTNLQEKCWTNLQDH
jgi:hypothetical protein